PKQAGIVLTVPYSHLEVSGTMVAMRDDADIFKPVKLPQSRTIRTNTVIDLHDGSFRIAGIWQKSLLGGIFSAAANFGFSAPQFFEPTAKKKTRPHGAWGTR